MDGAKSQSAHVQDLVLPLFTWIQSNVPMWNQYTRRLQEEIETPFLHKKEYERWVGSAAKRKK